MFLLSVSLLRPRLDEVFPMEQRKSARSIHIFQQVSVDSLFACRHLSSYLSHVPIAV